MLRFDRTVEERSMRIDKLRESPHWSYSAMQCYLSCPLKYKFRYIDNAEPERTGSCFPFGRAFHAALSERARIGKDRFESNGKKKRDLKFSPQISLNIWDTHPPAPRLRRTGYFIKILCLFIFNSFITSILRYCFISLFVFIQHNTVLR